MSETMLKGRYRHLAEIGRGERTVAYKAMDTLLDRTVVVKVLRERYAADQEFGERFQGAARAMAGLSHPNIVAIHDIGKDRDLHYVVTEYVEGQNLESLLATGATLGLEMTLDIAIAVCDALGAAHRAGYIHGHLTPRNILLTPEGQVRVSDFGVSETPTATHAGEATRSPYPAIYLSPEQLMGRRATPASDVYSVGVILYEMLTGRPPFHGESFAEIAEQHIRREPEPIHDINPQVPRPLSVLIHPTLAKTSANRYRAGSDLAATLREYWRESARTELAAAAVPLEPPEARRIAPGLPEDGAYPRSAEEDLAFAEESSSLGIDWPGCIMGMAALVAVLGLIPLWLAVYLRYLS